MSMCPSAGNDKWKDFGDYQLEKIEIITTNNTISIAHLVKEINIYEDMFATFISGNVVIEDAVGIVETVPIKDLDEIYIRLRTPGIDGPPLEYRRVIYKIEPSSPGGPDASREIFKLHFTGLEQLIDSAQTISKTYQGTHSSIASDIFAEYFQNIPNPTGGQGIIEVEPTTKEIRYTAPSTTPAQTIAFLTNGAVSQINQSPSYVFFENSRSFNFKSIEMLKQQSPIMTITYDIQQLPRFDLAKRKHAVLKLISNVRNDALADIKYGKYGVITIVDDVMLNETEIIKFEETQSSRTKISDKKPREIIEQLSKSRSSRIQYRPVNTQLYDDGDSSHGETFLQWHGERRSYFMDLLNTRTIAVISGDVRPTVGDTIELEAASRRDKTSNEHTRDKTLSGKYIITAVSHNITKNGHYTAIEMMRHGWELSV